MKRSNQTTRKGFTLIELLTVMAVIAVLVGMIIGMAGYAQRKAGRSKNRALIERVKAALEAYRVEYGKYPINEDPENSENLCEALWEKPQQQGKKPFLALEGWDDPDETYRITDINGQDIRYLHRRGSHPAGYADHNNSRLGYDLWTVVMDDETGTMVPDITNWKRAD